jgi:DNA end-binding protein Ku
MFFENEIAPAEEIPGLPDGEAHVDKRQLEAALQLIDSITEKWDPSKYSDEYAAKVEKLVEEKVSGGEVTTELAAAPEEGGQVVDLLDALRRSVAEKPREKRPQRAKKRRTHRKAG